MLQFRMALGSCGFRVEVPHTDTQRPKPKSLQCIKAPYGKPAFLRSTTVQGLGYLGPIAPLGFVVLLFRCGHSQQVQRIRMSAD